MFSLDQELAHFLQALWGLMASFALAWIGVVREAPERRFELAFRYLASLAFALLCFGLVGFQVLAGPSWRGLTGVPKPGLGGDFGTQAFIGHAVAVALGATVLAGALGSRVMLTGHLLVAAVFATFLYPVVGHWLWARGPAGEPVGWLGALGAVDRAGAGPVHIVAGAAVLALLTRAGSGRPGGPTELVPSRGALSAAAALAWVGWLGLAGARDPGAGNLGAAWANLTAAAAFGALVAFGLDTQSRRPERVSALARGLFAGLVAGSAPLADADLPGAALLGAVAGALAEVSYRFRRDPHEQGTASAVDVHLLPGAWGLLAVAVLFRSEPMDAAARWAFLRTQALGVGAAAAWTFILTSIVVLFCERWLVRKDGDASAETRDGMPRTATAERDREGEPFGASALRVDPGDERARMIVEGALDAVVSMDARGRIIGWNAKAEEVFGWLRHEVIGRPAADIVAPARLRGRFKERLAALATPGPGDLIEEWTDLVFQRRDGSEILTQTAVVPLRRDSSYELCAFVRDLSEFRREADEKEAIGIVSQLLLAADGLEAIYQDLPEVLSSRFRFPIVVIETCDATMARMAVVASTGLDAARPPLSRFPADKILSGHVATTGRAIVDVAVAKRPAHQLGALRDAGASALLCVPMKTRTEMFGTITIADTAPRDIPASVCESIQIIANYLAQTISRRRTEERLLAQRREQQVIFDAVPAMIWYKDAENRIVRANRAAAAAFGLDIGELEGRTTAELFPAEAAEQYRADLEIIRTGEARFGLIEEVRLPTGQRRWLQTDKIPYRNADGEAVGVIVFAVDVTERRRIERELAEARDAALESARLKSQFLANMSHEIRTPLNGVIGMTELVLDTELSDEQREFLTISLSSARSLLSLLNDILDFAKIEAGKLELRASMFDLRADLAALMKTLGAKAHEKGLEIAYDILPRVPTEVVGDPDRLRQIVLNLVDNAIKFTEHGEVVLLVDVESRDESDIVLHFSVRDTGIGMDDAARARIFDAFWQADGTSTRRFGGTGLGLGIVAELVNRMGGRVWVESELGQGSTFHFTARLKTARALSAPVGPEPAATLAGRTALVVDHNATTRGILCDMLGRWGVEVRAVDDAAAAASAADDAAARGARFDLVVIDADLPDLGADALLPGLRARSATAAATALMMASSPRRVEDFDAATGGVAHAWLVKPVSQSDLFDAIVAAGRGHAVHLDGTAEAKRPRATPSLRILLAEDNQVNERVAVRILEKAGHRVDVARNGREAVDAFARDRYDVVLMDVQMPDMNGYEATDRIRAVEMGTGYHTPVIALTAHNMQGDRERCLEAGMDDYVSKPIGARALEETIARVLARSASGFRTVEVSEVEQFEDESSAQAERNGSAATERGRAGERDEAASVDDMVGIEHDAVAAPTIEDAPAAIFDIDDALARIGRDEDLLRELAALFIEEAAELLDGLRASLNSCDSEGVERAAHALKGSAANIGATKVRAAAYRLEECGRRGDLVQADALFVEVERTFEALRPVLERYAVDRAA